MRIPYFRRIAIYVGVTLFCLLGALALVVVMFFHEFYPDVPAADFPPANDPATAQRQDLEYFAQYLRYEQAYTPATRLQAERLRQSYVAQAGSLSPAQFDLAIGSMVALADNGHSTLYVGPLSRLNDRIPCRLYHFTDGYFVIRARHGCIGLLGAQVLKVDGQPIDTVATHMYAYTRGPRNHYDQFLSVFYLESPALLHAAGIAAGDDRITLHVRAEDGSERDETVLADPPDPDAPRVFSDSYLSPQHIEKEPMDWRPLLQVPDGKLPVFLQDYAKPFQSAYWADQRIYYVQFRSNEDEPGYPIRSFVQKVEQGIATHHPRDIVLDLRLDQGGNFVTTASFMEHLAEAVSHIYVLTSAWTFSAGDVSLALVRDRGAGKVTVIGEAPGDRLRLWAEGGSIKLPNSGLVLGFATGLHDYAHSCWREPGCFWTMYLFPTHVTSLLPDRAVSYRFQDYRGLRDPMLDKALELSRSAP